MSAASQHEQELDALSYLEERITRAVELVNELRAENADLRGQLTAAMAEASEARGEAQSARAELDGLRSERKQVRSRIEKLLGQMELLSTT